MTHSRVKEILVSKTFVGCLPESVINDLIRSGQNKLYPADEALCHRGDPGHSAMLVLSGRLKVSNVTGDGREITLNYLGIGDLVGEIALLDNQPRTANVTALEPSEVFVLQRRDLLPVLQTNPDAMFEVVKALCAKLRRASAMIEDGTHLMPARVGKALLRLAEQHGVRTNNGIRIELRLSQTEIGNYCGLTRANVNRQIQAFTKDGLLEINAHRITIIDEPRLTAIAQGLEHRPA